MTTITASLVNELRQITGAGMMDCKKALEATNGDVEGAVELMRKQGQAKAVKKAGRVAAEGLIVVKISDGNKNGIIMEINCETDFVARDDNFKYFCETTASQALANKASDVGSLGGIVFEDSITVEQARETLISKIGENIQIRRLAYMTTAGVLSSYIHGGRIGVVVELENGTAELGKDIAMHIAASNPTVIAPEDVSADIIAKEKEIFTAQAVASGKSQEIAEKMVGGRIKKFLEEVTLLGQPFVKDPNMTVGELVKKANAKVVSFIRYEVGEGIEKKVDNFVEEVMAQVRGS